MAANKPHLPDPLIDEVRQRRRDLSARLGNDLDKLVEVVRAIEAEHPEQVFDRRAMLDKKAATLGNGAGQV